jgi:queuine tRNA-ribosyltransferase
MDIQRVIGADIIMAFDECTPYPCDYSYAVKSLKLTHAWLDRCLARMGDTMPEYGHTQALFPIVQGSVYKDLRLQSSDYVASKNAPGNAIGGLAVGEPAEMMYELVELVCDVLPDQKPRYLMGVGTPANLLEAIALGVDMFDCVLPTRNGRNGMLFTRNGTLNMRNEKWKDDFSPIDPGGPSYVDEFYSKAYLRHLFKSGEMLGPMIATLHNLAFYHWLMSTARQRISDGEFSRWKREMLPCLNQKL